MHGGIESCAGKDARSRELSPQQGQTRGPPPVLSGWPHCDSAGTMSASAARLTARGRGPGCLLAAPTCGPLPVKPPPTPLQTRAHSARQPAQQRTKHTRPRQGGQPTQPGGNCPPGRILSNKQWCRCPSQRLGRVGHCFSPSRPAMSHAVPIIRQCSPGALAHSAAPPPTTVLPGCAYTLSAAPPAARVARGCNRLCM